MRRFGFSGGGLALGEARIENARLCLHETPEGELNIKQVVARLSRKKKKREGELPAYDRFGPHRGR